MFCNVCCALLVGTASLLLVCVPGVLFAVFVVVEVVARWFVGLFGLFP